MSPAPGRGNARASVERLTHREQAELRPEVERMAGRGMTYREIAEALRTPQLPVNMRMVRTIQYKYGIPSGAKPGRKAGTVGPADRGASSADRITSLKEARAAIRPLIEKWIADRWTDAQMAAALNERGVPTLSGTGEWTIAKVESLRRREGVRSVIGHHHLQRTKFVVPRGHEAHCNTCDAPIHFDRFGKAALHKRITSMIVAGVRQVGRCEGSGEPVVCRPIRQYDVAVAA